jgi:two-component system sensor histidine kinase ChiS
VNLASRLESLTKTYGASLIVSGESLEQCAAPDRYKSRFLDQIQVTGKIFPVSIYEILDAEDPQSQAVKYELAEEYKNGWQLFCDGRIEEAIMTFYGITEKNPKDAAAEEFLRRCRDYLHDRML